MKAEETLRMSERIMIVVIIIIQVSILITGYYVFTRLQNLVSVAQQTTSDSRQIELLRDAVNSVSIAERDVKSYYLTRNESFLANYYITIAKTGELVDSLEKCKWHSDKQQALAQDINYLIESKIRVFDELLNLENNEIVTEQLVSISEEVDKIKIPVLTEKEIKEKTESKQKKSFLNRLFGRDKKEVDSIAAAIQMQEGKRTLQKAKKEIKKKVYTVKKDQVDQLKDIKRKEYKITEQNIRISNEISMQLHNLEELEKNEIEERNKSAIVIANHSNRIILVFGSILLFFLITTGIIIIRYIYANKRKRRLLKSQHMLAMAYARSKQNLISNMSHEIRTPLNSIIGFTEQLLKNPELDNNSSEQLQIIKKSSDHLLEIVNNILDNAKMEAGKFVLHSAPFSPAQVLNEIVNVISILAINKGLRLELNISKDIPEYIQGDAVRFRQILLNVIGNSLKYTETGKVSIELSASPQIICITICDTGKGIPAAKLESIFNQFEQVVSHEGSSGLGLFITRNLLKMMNGSIEISSTEGTGTTVSIKMPYTVTKENNISRTILDDFDNVAEKLKGLTILIADDEKFNRQLLVVILKKYGINYVEAETGAEVLKLVEKYDFDLILMDVRMPDIDGLVATKTIRAIDDSRKSATYIIGITAGLVSEKIKLCNEVGMNGFLSKPFKEKQLIEELLKAVNKDSINN